MTKQKMSLDTNILFYAFDKGNKAKQNKACKTIEWAIDNNCALALQVLSKFFAATTRKKLLSPTIAQAQVDDWQTIFTTILPKIDTLKHAINTQQKYHLSFWDSLILETLHQNGVGLFYSEDFQHNQQIKGVKIINPFLGSSVAYNNYLPESGN